MSAAGRVLHRLTREQDGAIAILVALSMVALFGFMALALDAGALFVEQTQLQKAVDAAALAAAQDIRTAGYPANATTDMNNYLAYNGSSSSELASPYGAVTVYNGPCAANGCTGWQVTAQRTVNLAFAPVLGIPQGTVTATATAIKSPIQSISSDQMMNFALWAGNPSGTYSKPVPYAPAPGGLTAGSQVIFRDNQWARDVVADNPAGCVIGPESSWPSTYSGQPVCAWDVTSQANFKGFFNNCNCIVTLGSTVSVDAHAGNGGADSAKVCSLQGTTNVGVFPVIDWAYESSGTITLHVLSFRAAYIDGVAGCPNPPAGQPWRAHIAPPTKLVNVGVPGGNDPNAPQVLQLWQ